MVQLLDYVESLLASERRHAPEAEEELLALEAQRESLLRDISIAISTGSLAAKCAMVEL